MANSILGSGANTSAPQNAGMPDMQMLQQLKAFKQNFKGNPKQMVMQMLQSGQITNPQLQQAMQMAKQIQGLIK